jgi:adenylate kinase
MNIIILGPQGSGKGTQAELLAKKFKLEHIDMGKYLREAARLDTPLGKEINTIINVKKELISDRILKKIIELKLKELPREQGIVFDGVPRNKSQLHYLEKVITEVGREINLVVAINLSEAKSIQRIANRRICNQCKKVYILGKDKEAESGICSQCGGAVVRRVDDTLEGIKKRLQIFKKETLPIINYYQEQGKVIEIDGDQTIKKINKDIEKRIKKELI